MKDRNSLHPLRAGLLTALLCAWQKAPLHLDGGMLTVYAALAALLLFTYWHPVHRSLKRVLRPL